MIVDASALVAIMMEEGEAEPLLKRLGPAWSRWIQPISIYEASLAVARQKGRSPAFGREMVVRFLSDLEIHQVDIGAAEATAALDAFARYGKGRHPAALNMGDCFSYACAKLRGVPLLYKGDDFAQTDLA